MKMLQAFRMAFTTLLSKKARSFLTMLGTIIGVAAVIAIVSVMRSQNEANRNLYQTLSENMVEVYYYPPNMQSDGVAEQLIDFINYDIRDLTVGMTPYSQDQRVVLGGGKEIQEGRIYFGSEMFSACQGYTITQGRDLCFMDIEENTSVCVIGSYVKETLFGYKDPIGEVITAGDARFTVVGVFDSMTTEEEMEYEWYDPVWTRDNIILLPYTQIRYIVRDQWNKNISNFQVKCKDAASTKEAVALITGFFEEVVGKQDESGYRDFSKGQYNVSSQSSEYADEIKENEDSQTFTMMIVAFISLLVGGIGIMNIMLVTVTERTREIGIRKAIGAPKRSIVTQFLIEACVMSGLGGFLGVFVGFAATLFWGKIQYKIIATPDLFTTLLAFFVSVAMGIAFGIYPAAKAAGLQPVDALRND